MIFLDPYDNLQLPMGVTKGFPPKILQQIKLEEPQGLGFARVKKSVSTHTISLYINTQ